METTATVPGEDIGTPPDFNDGRAWELVRAEFRYRPPSSGEVILDSRINPLTYNLDDLIQIAQSHPYWIGTTLIYQQIGGAITGTEEDLPGVPPTHRKRVIVNDGGQKKESCFLEKQDGTWILESPTY